MTNDDADVAEAAGSGAPITLTSGHEPGSTATATATATADADYADYADYADPSQTGKPASRNEPGFFKETASGRRSRPGRSTKRRKIGKW
jgi:hypothetical protein